MLICQVQDSVETGQKYGRGECQLNGLTKFREKLSALRVRAGKRIITTCTRFTIYIGHELNYI